MASKRHFKCRLKVFERPFKGPVKSILNDTFRRPFTRLWRPLKSLSKAFKRPRRSLYRAFSRPSKSVKKSLEGVPKAFQRQLKAFKMPLKTFSTPFVKAS
jgi:hypothetical protein